MDNIANVTGNPQSSIPIRVKSMTYKIDTCHFLTWWSALLGYDEDWLAQLQDNVTEWDIWSWCSQPGLPVGATL